MDPAYWRGDETDDRDEDHERLHARVDRIYDHTPHNEPVPLIDLITAAQRDLQVD
ncbi:MAG: hypothetical protein JHD16_00420 [Solirubrobacteraceae bacterium]|nr:hypothetical protein [Solirubrobacteraceae bacterium]